jgi:hypothetical protein
VILTIHCVLRNRIELGRVLARGIALRTALPAGSTRRQQLESNDVREVAPQHHQGSADSLILYQPALALFRVGTAARYKILA